MWPRERQEARRGALPVSPDTSAPVAASASASGSAVPRTDAVADASGAADVPGIPDAVRAAARQAPGHWIGVVDPEWTGRGAVPEWAVLGEWQSDEHGETTEFRANPDYRPSARMLGWPEPTDPVDAAAQRAATGYGSTDEALDALAEADVTVVRGPDGAPLTAVGQHGDPVVLLFTAPAHEFMSPALRHDTLATRELVRSLSGPGTWLLVNAGAAAPLLVPADRVPGPQGEDRTVLTADSPATPGPDGPLDPVSPTTGRTS
ncbi:type VII secretion system-associated protein [Streptomyces longwoodensis]|uniref:type VII secretion system-associated protein n=1 Tax=Streptomyces longwoodensis TaxID=68231 RepID=UPI003F4D5009